MVAVAVAVGIAAAAPRFAPVASAAPVVVNTAPEVFVGGIPRAAMDEFRDICSDLESARARLASGRIDSGTFADTLLALFVRADSLAHLIAAGPRGPSWITLQRGNGYLIDSIRDNWIGASGQNGMSFADADVALKAAAAWRSNVAEVATP